jgi:hypothetical protein
MPRFTTELFPFGANAPKAKSGGGKKSKGKGKRRRGGTTSSKSRKFFAGMHGS